MQPLRLRATTAAAISTTWRSPPRKPRSTKPSKKSNNNPPTYMRSTIAAISNLLRYSTWQDAQLHLRTLTITWDSFTVNQVLKTHPPMEKAWIFFNWASKTLPNFKHDRFTYTTMLDIFGEAGRIDSMRHLFDEMSMKGICPDAASYTSAMHWVASSGDFEGAVAMWEEMKRKGCKPTVVSYTAFVKVLLGFGKAEEAGKIYKEMIDAGHVPNCHTYTVMMDYLAGRGNFGAAMKIWTEMQEAGVYPDKATCNILIQKCAQAGETSAMFQILRYMKEHLIVLRRPIFLEALEAIRDSGENDQLLREVNPHLSSKDVEDQLSDSEVTSDDVLLTDKGLVLSFLSKKNFFALEQLLREMIYKESALDSALVCAVLQTSCSCYRQSGALLAFEYSKKKGKKLDRTTYISLLGMIIRTDSSLILDIVEEMLEAGTRLGSYLISLLICKLGSVSLSSASAKIFYFCGDQNTATYTALIDAYFRAGEVDKALDLFITMKRQGIPTSSGTYKVLIVGMEDAGRVCEAEAFRKEKKRMQWDYYSLKDLSHEQILCNCLFDS